MGRPGPRFPPCVIRSFFRNDMSGRRAKDPSGEGGRSAPVMSLSCYERDRWKGIPGGDLGPLLSLKAQILQKDPDTQMKQRSVANTLGAMLVAAGSRRAIPLSVSYFGSRQRMREVASLLCKALPTLEWKELDGGVVLRRSGATCKDGADPFQRWDPGAAPDSPYLIEWSVGGYLVHRETSRTPPSFAWIQERLSSHSILGSLMGFRTSCEVFQRAHTSTSSPTPHPGCVP